MKTKAARLLRFTTRATTRRARLAAARVRFRLPNGELLALAFGEWEAGA